MSTAAFIAAQRTGFGIPHALACRALDVSESWFYKWHDRLPTERQRRRDDLDAAVRAAFDASGRAYGSPRIHADVTAEGWKVSVNSVAESMVRQGLIARPKKRRRNLTQPDKAKAPFPDLVGRDFTAGAPNLKWVGDMTEIPTDEGKLYLATVEDLFARAMPGFAIGEHHDAGLVCDALCMAVAFRGQIPPGVIFHSDRGSEYTSDAFEELCRRLGVRQSMGRVGSCFDNAAAESFNSTLEHEVLSRHHFATKDQARLHVATWIVDTYNVRRRHSSAGMMAPLTYERVCAGVVGRAAGSPPVALAAHYLTSMIAATASAMSIDSGAAAVYDELNERRSAG